jgi:hypothetical protein
MSLCYDFQKWTIITLASIAICLTISLINIAYGQIQDMFSEEKVNRAKFFEMRMIVDYCHDHPEIADPVQDLADKHQLLFNFSEGHTCEEIEDRYDLITTYLFSDKEIEIEIK